MHSRRKAAVVQELAFLNRTPCFHFSPVAMRWAWLGRQAPYTGPSSISAPLRPRQRQQTQKRQNKQLPFRGKHISANFLLGEFCLCVYMHVCTIKQHIRTKCSGLHFRLKAVTTCSQASPLASPGLSFPIWICKSQARYCLLALALTFDNSMKSRQSKYLLTH